jgi:O-phospho-L-seryl-tRNASec:L-selenocysteinyl-tRNA synthase
MNESNLALAQGLVRAGYIRQGAQGIAARERLVTALLSERRLPATGWDEASIESLVHDASLMDSNNFLANVGLGEREARVVCPLVSRRHYGLAHGIGRSGDITAEQPKAAGSTLLAKLCNLLTADALKVAGLPELIEVTVLPVATGMALTLTLLALKKRRPAAARCALCAAAPLPSPRLTHWHCAHPKVRGLAALRPKDVRKSHRCSWS